MTMNLRIFDGFLEPASPKKDDQLVTRGFIVYNKPLNYCHQLFLTKVRIKYKILQLSSKFLHNFQVVYLFIC